MFVNVTFPLQQEQLERERRRNEVPVKERCIAKDCPHRHRDGGVYCGDKCVEKHAEQSLQLVATQRKKIYGQFRYALSGEVIQYHEYNFEDTHHQQDPKLTFSSLHLTYRMLKRILLYSANESVNLGARVCHGDDVYCIVTGNKSLSTTERVVVMERKSGKLLTGPAAPTEATLKLWLKNHETFEILQPGQNIMGTGSTLKREYNVT